MAFVLEAVRAAGIERCVAVVGHGADEVRASLSPEADPPSAEGKGLAYAEQPRPRGTGDAVARAKEAAAGAGHVLVLNGDIPLVTAETVRGVMAHHLRSGADLTVLTARVDDARGLGRLQRDAAGRPVGVVEVADMEGPSAPTGARPGEGPAEVNAGIYAFRAQWLWPRVGCLPASAGGERYLTSLVGIAAREGAALETVAAADAAEGLGINDRLQLAKVEAILRERIRRRHLLAGVTMVDPQSTYIDADVTIGEDTVIYPNTTLRGRTAVGRDCAVGPNSLLVDSTLGDRCRVVASVLEGAVLESDVEVGPFSHLRPGSYIATGAHIGNFAETKNARLGRHVKMGHFSYIGDATVGEEANIGAGTITCNYDGVTKHRTVIGEGAFIGSDTLLVAPVTVGENAATAAGAVVNRDVPPNSLAVGAPARIRSRRGAARLAPPGSAAGGRRRRAAAPISPPRAHDRK